MAVIVDGIKGEVRRRSSCIGLGAKSMRKLNAYVLLPFVFVQVVAIPANFGPCASIGKRSVIIADPFDGAISFRNADSMKDKVLVLRLARAALYMRSSFD